MPYDLSGPSLLRSVKHHCAIITRPPAFVEGKFCVLILESLSLQRVSIVCEPGSDKVSRVDVDIPVFTKAAPVTERLLAHATQVVANTLSVPEDIVQVHPTAHIHSDEQIANVGPGLANVGSVIAVSSGKGGVGKSTVAVNLAFALRKLGASVGLFDTDIYGPSLPTMISPLNTSVYKSEDGRSMNAVNYEDVQCMSYGYIAPRNAKGERQGAIMRGPMISQVLLQMLRFTAWGNLDHLVVDTPPGTGDIHLSLGQSVPLTGAVIVTTPQTLSIVDVKKGIEMYRKLKVPILAIVFNMNHFVGDDGKVYYPLGNGIEKVKALLQECDIPASSLFSIPMEEQIATAGDSGVPLVLSHPDSETSKTYEAIARHVAASAHEWMHSRQKGKSGASADIAEQEHRSGDVLSWEKGHIQSMSVVHNPQTGAMSLRIIGADTAEQVPLPLRAMRLACRCAGCIDEVTGDKRLNPEKVPEDIRPTSVAVQGNYGVAVTWSDRHATSIYPYEQLLEIYKASK